MVPYFGKHGCKQFIHGKPIRYGYKFWVGALKEGYVLWFEPYQGAGTLIDSKYKQLGLGASVVLHYADVLKSSSSLPYHLFFDNFFTSFALLQGLTEKGIRGTGTIRENRIQNCSVAKSKEMNKKPRGSYDYRVADSINIIVVNWNDNKVPFLASNAVGVNPIREVKRYSKKDKKNIQVPQPKVINQYNAFMGGVDRADQNISLYRTSIRGKKWYFPIIAYCIDVAEQNAWQLHRGSGGNLDHLAFRRRVATSILEGVPKPSKQNSSKGHPGRHELEDIRYDRMDHLVIPQATQTRCKLCHQKATTRCQKCDCGLHVKCFVAFHTK
jgi:DNA excision repair protein ERCC-6